MTAFDAAWADAVLAQCEPVLAAADVGFTHQVGFDDPVVRRVTSLLWEADPLAFVERYPDRGVAESYGEQWPAPCLDWWVYLEDHPTAPTFSFEGVPGDAERAMELTGDADVDGPRLADRFREMLR